MDGGAAALLRELHAAEDFAAQLRRRAAERPGRVALPEGEDPRVIRAAIALRELAIARPTLLGRDAPIRESLVAEGVDPGIFDVVDPASDPRAESIAAQLFARRAAKGMSEQEAIARARTPLAFATGLLALGQVDAVVAGAAHNTADVVRSALHAIGLREGVSVVSGAFLMLPPAHAPLRRPLLFADAGVIPQPTLDELQSIGRAAARCFEFLLRRPGRIACISFSTHGSAEHEAARRMRELAERLRADGLDADGELQVDAALIPEIAARKAPGSPIGGAADVLVFPDLGAANSAYKLVERLGGWTALGPLLLGFARPVYDLSRGCSARDIVDISAIAILESVA